MDRCCTISHRPTPPACGHTGTPNLAASSRLAMFSLTPATRHASICMMSIAPAWRSCLKTTRLETCSPVATGIGLTARRAAARRGREGVPAASLCSPTPRGPDARKRAHPRDGSSHVPDLIRVQRDADLPADHLTRDRAAPEVVFQPASDLELDQREALLNGRGAQLGHPLIRIAEPAR